MKRLVYAVILAIFSASFSLSQVPLAQTPATTGPILTGFVVVTPQNGGGQGLSVSETFGEHVNGSFFQSSVLPSPLVTLTNVVVNVDLNSGIDTGIAMLNPNDATAAVRWLLTAVKESPSPQEPSTLQGERNFQNLCQSCFLAWRNFHSLSQGHCSSVQILPSALWDWHSLARPLLRCLWRRS